MVDSKMMRRKFSFNFRDAFGAGKSESKNGKGGHESSDDYTPPSSPYPGRRDALPGRVEMDLRLACAAIVTNNIPSDAYVENPYEQLGRPQMDYTAVRSSSEAGRQRSMSASKHARNPAPLASTIEFPDFPLPNGPLDRSKYTYKPDTASKDLFAEPDPSRSTALTDRTRRRAESVNSLDKQNPSSGRQTSRSFSVVSNLTLNHPPVRPKQVRRAMSPGVDVASPSKTDSSELPLGDSAAHTSTTFSRHEPKRISYHGSGRVAPSLPPSEPDERAMKRRSWYRPLVRNKKKQEEGPEKTSRPQSRARSITRRVHEYIRPGSTSRGRSTAASVHGISTAASVHGRSTAPSIQGRSTAPSIQATSDVGSRQGSQARSISSRRSDTSSRAVPTGKQIFNWKSWRQSWTTFKDAAEDDAIHTSGTLRKRQSGVSLRNRMSLNLNRALPPLPSINQWQGEDPPLPMSTQVEQSGTPLPEKPKHIATLWNRAASKPKLVELRRSDKDLKKQYRKSMIQPPRPTTTTGTEQKRRHRKSYSDFTYEHPRIPLEEFESPILPHVMATLSRPSMSSTKLPRTSTIATKSTPTDSVMDDQVAEMGQQVHPPLEEIGIAKSTPDVVPVLSSAQKIPRVPVGSKSSPRAAGDGPASISPPPLTGLPAVPPKGLPRTESSSSSTADAAAKRRASMYSWLPAGSDHRDMSPASRSTSLSAKRRSGNYSWLPPETGTTPPIEWRRSRLDLQSPAGPPIARPKQAMDKQSNGTRPELPPKSRPDTATSEVFNRLQSMKYRYAEDITHLGSPPPVPAKDGKSKPKWRLGKKKSTTWMDEMEKLGVKDGVLLTDQLDSAPIVRY